MKNSAIILAMGLLVISCENKENAVVENSIKSNTEEHDMLIKNIDSLETVLYADTFNLEDETAAALMRKYILFTTKFVADKERSPEYLYKAAALARGARLPVKALKFYNQILDDYPDFIRNSEVAFLLAFTYDEDLNEKGQAKEAYQAVVDKFPGDIWAIQSEERLKTIDMTDDELVKFFMEKNKK